MIEVRVVGPLCNLRTVWLVNGEVQCMYPTGTRLSIDVYNIIRDRFPFAQFA